MPLFMLWDATLYTVMPSTILWSTIATALMMPIWTKFPSSLSSLPSCSGTKWSRIFSITIPRTHKTATRIYPYPVVSSTISGIKSRKATPAIAPREREEIKLWIWAFPEVNLAQTMPKAKTTDKHNTTKSAIKLSYFFFLHSPQSPSRTVVVRAWKPNNSSTLLTIAWVVA